jgi:tetratricopeptide (TPR) repeat protein
MNGKERFETRIAPLLLFVVALGLRLAHIAAIHALPSFEHPYEGLDADLYTRLGLAIVGGDLFPRALLDAAPFYAYWLASFLRLLGDGALAPRVAQAVLGAAAVPLLYWIGRRVSGRGAGAVAGIGAALYQPFFLYEGSIQSAALVPFLSALSILLVVRARSGRALAALGAGLSIGVSILNRPDMLPLLLLLPAWLAWSGARRGAAICFAGALLPVLPFAAIGSSRAGGFVPLSAHGGIHFYIGNHEGADGTLSPVEGIRATPEGFARDARALASREAGRPLGPAETSRFFFREGFSWIGSRPGAFLSLLARKAVLFWNDYEIPNNEDLAFMRRHSLPLRPPLPLFGVVAALGLFGLFLGRLREGGRALLALLVLAVFGSALLFFVTGRYRLPAVPPLLVLAGAGAAAWGEAARQRRRTAFLLLPLLLVTNWPVRKFDFAAPESRLASSYLRAGDLDSAEEAYRRAESIRPGFPEARRGLARVLDARGRTDEAAAIYADLARSARERGDARVDLAALLARSGRFDEANALLDSLLRENPRDAYALTNRAASAMQAGDDSLASVLLEKAIEADPDSPEPYLNLALLRAKRGDPAGSLPLFDRHLALDPASERGLFNAGTARAMSGDLESAILLWERLREIRPSYPNLEANLDRARALLRDAGPHDRARQ